MFSVRQKRDIADKIQAILKETNHPELPEGEINFQIHVDGAESWSWADIQNNGVVALKIPGDFVYSSLWNVKLNYGVQYNDEEIKK